MAQNNAGNGYFAVLPNNEETIELVKELRKHLSPDRKIVMRGQGKCTDGRTHKYYTHGLPVKAASHVRLYLQPKKSSGYAPSREEKYWRTAYSDAVAKYHTLRDSVKDILVLDKQGLL